MKKKLEFICYYGSNNRKKKQGKREIRKNKYKNKKIKM